MCTVGSWTELNLLFQQIISNFNIAFQKWTCGLWKDINRQDPFCNFAKLQVMQIRGNACARYGLAGKYLKLDTLTLTDIHCWPPLLLSKDPE